MMKKTLKPGNKLPFLVVNLLLVAALWLSGCTAGKTSTPQTLPTSAGPTSPPLVVTVTPQGTGVAPAVAGQPAGGPKTASIAFIQDFDSMNPLYAQALSAIYSQSIYSCRAWNFDDQNNALPILAAEVPSQQNGGVSADGRTITIKLRDGMTWSDGQPLTADDFVFTYQMITSASNNIIPTQYFDPSLYTTLVESVTAPDAKTVVVTFKEPYAPWLSALWKVVLPKHILEPVYQSAGSIQSADWNQSPTVGCGPFIFQNRAAGQSVTFVANDHYWLGRPKLDEIDVRFVADDDAKIQALQSGQADLSVFLTNSAMYALELKNSGLQLLNADPGYVEGLFFYLGDENSNPALKDIRVRQAIAMGIDRQKMIGDLLGSGQAAAASYWDNTPYVDPSVKPWPYDPEKAKQLLDEAGWVDSNSNGTRDKDGIELVLSYGTTTNTVRQAVQNSIKTQLADLGITLDLQNIDENQFFQWYSNGGPVAAGQYDIFEYAPRTKNYPDPGTNDFLCSQVPSANGEGENWSWICDENLDKLLQLQDTQMDFQQRQQTFLQISKIIYDNAYFIGLWNDPDVWAASQRLKNVRLSGVTTFFNIAEWDLP